MHFNNDSELYKVIGLSIRRYRENVKLTQMQLVGHSQISISHLSKIEAIGYDKSLSISILDQITNALSVDIIEFFGEVQIMARIPNRFGGSSCTNEYGLFSEQTTDLNEALRDAGFDIINKYDVYYNNKFIGRSINKRAFSDAFLSVNGINYLDYNSKRRDPDEAFINEPTQTVYIIERKSQSSSGSVDEKLATSSFKIYEYQKLLDPIGCNIVYIYLLSFEWFDSPKYQDYYDYMDKLDCPHYFDVLPLSAIGL